MRQENGTPKRREANSVKVFTPAVKIHHQGQATALDRLHGFSITGNSAAMRQQMLDDVFVLRDIALLGQWTTLYASPNTGKTLITLWLLAEALRELEIDGHYVFYVNADDSFKGTVEKTELAESWGFHMVTPNQNGFTSSEVPQMMLELAETGDAKGVVIILDTLKKFTDLMHKRESSEFGNVSREFISAGGTLICLAHTNKHRSADGKPIYSGTSDISDDCDCVYILDKLDGRMFEDEVAVEFVNEKNRGDVASSVSFSYSKKHGQTYAELIDSVKRIDDGTIEELRLEAEITRKLEEEDDVIASVRSAINQAVTTKAAIVKFVADETGTSHAKVRKILAERTGTMYSLGHRWSVEIGAHNKSTYSFLAAAEPAP